MTYEMEAIRQCMFRQKGSPKTSSVCGTKSDSTPYSVSFTSYIIGSCGSSCKTDTTSRSWSKSGVKRMARYGTNV